MPSREPGDGDMFERYTEKARRVIFFARYETNEFGSPRIESEFILMGLLRESPQVVTRWLQQREDWPEVFRKKIADTFEVKGKPSTSVDLPLSDEAKRVLSYAAEEAERLAHQHIGTEHLFLALLREPKSHVAKMLSGMGVDANTVRVTLAKEGGRDRMRSGIESGGKTFAAQQRALQIMIVADGSAKPLRAQWPARIPTEDEILFMGEENESPSEYRVTKVEWQATTYQGELAVLSKAIIHVSRV